MLLISEVIPWPTSKHDILQEMVKTLDDWNCCTKCILRFLCIKEPNFFQLFELPYLTDWLNASGNDKFTFESEREHVCVACLGVLQEKFSTDSFVSSVVDSIKSQGHEFDDFFCAVTLPVSLLIREQSIYIALVERFPDVFKSLECKNTVTNIKDVWKWINGPKMMKILGVPFSQKSQFEVQIYFEYKNDDKECNCFTGLMPKDGHRRRKYNRFNRNNMTRVIKDTKAEEFKMLYKCPPELSTLECHCEVITCFHQPIYVAGRYNKFSRVLSQTPWFIEGEKKFEDSVEEIICKSIVEKFGAKEHKFSSSGREDVDVRMLGHGRPFLIEILNPKKIKMSAKEMRDMESVVNASSSDVFIRDLQIVSKDDTKHLKEGEEEKIKKYRAICLLGSPISDEKLDRLREMKDVVLSQKTPIRVLHRRPLAVRLRTVHEMSAMKLDDRRIVLTLSTQAGTYVKEFVHGDFGRTQPNLGELLGCECDILQLDVDEVLLDWPPPVVYDNDGAL